MNLLKNLQNIGTNQAPGLFKTCRQVQLIASYSRSSSNSKSPYKIVGARYKNNKTSDVFSHENNPNWELFGHKNNRFFLASGQIGPAYLNSSTTVKGTINLMELVDFESKDKKKLHISTKKCPILLRKNLHELFPAPEVITENNNLTLITLSQTSNVNDHHEQAAKYFVIAAREMCARLRMHGYWADFLNPFSGRAFHAYHQKSLYSINDPRFRGLCMKFEEVKATGTDENVLILSEDKSQRFSGSIFTNISADLVLIKEFLDDD